MSPLPIHCSWFENTGQTLKTNDGREVFIIDFNYKQDELLLAEWALQFRKHYCSDGDLNSASMSMGLSKSDYLRTIKFPSNNQGFGPATRSGDFSEILIADYVQFLMDYDIPRVRYDRRFNPDVSTPGVDILGFKLIEGKTNSKDELITCEVKASLRTTGSNSLQSAIDDSIKDFEIRLPVALNATLQRLKDRGETESISLVERFMNKTKSPYIQVTGAFLVCSESCWSDDLVTQSDSSRHPNGNTFFLVLKGVDLMDLANKLYETAYVTA